MKKLSKIWGLIVCAFVLVFSGVVLTACGSQHEHNWSTMFSSNATVHWLTCDGCDEIKDEGNHTFIDDVCSVCGWIKPHEHTFVEGQYEKNDDYHWQDCTTCDGISTQEPHEMSGGTCIVCGHIDSSQNPEVSSIRDLEIITYQTDNGGVFTLVELPDGKNMLIDAGGTQAIDIVTLRNKVIREAGFTTIDYMVLTNTFANRTGGAEAILSNNVKNLYIPDTTGVTYSISDGFRTAVNYANTLNTCNIIKLNPTNDDNYDVTSTFSYNQQEYGYTIDFIAPVAPSDCETEFDASMFVAITYQNKVILLTGDATNANIDAYTNESYDYDVDVLITGYEPSSNKNAIKTAFLGDIELTSSDNVIITNYGIIDDINNLENVIGSCNPTIYNSTDFASATVKIAIGGTMTVSTQE